MVSIPKRLTPELAPWAPVGLPAKIPLRLLFANFCGSLRRSVLLLMATGHVFG
jgi:hypothetical protein